MKFKVEKLPQAEAEIKDLEESQQKLLSDEYTKIETQGIEFVRIKPIQKIFLKLNQMNFVRFSNIKPKKLLWLELFCKENTKNSKG